MPPAMIQPNAEFTQAVEAAIARIEAQTDAELVVVAASRSGGYRDIAAGLAMALTLGALLVASLSPWVFSPFILPIELAVLAAALTWLIDRSPALLRTFTSSARRAAQVDAAAAAAFYAERVHTTPGRTGALLYLSALEGEARVLTDTGLTPPALAWDLRSTAGVLAGLDALGAELARQAPPRADANPDHLGNAPRVRP